MRTYVGLQVCLALLLCLRSEAADRQVHRAVRDLHSAILDRRLGIDRVKSLLTRDPALINAPDEGGYTALHCAARRGDFELCRLLIERGAFIDLADNANRTPLWVALGKRNKDMAQLLVQNGAALDARSTSGETALSWVTRKWGPATAQALRNECRSSILAEARDPVEGWLHYRVMGRRDGRLTLLVLPRSHLKDAHRHKWVSESWTIGNPNLQVALLLPRGLPFDPSTTGFSGLEALHGAWRPGRWLEFRGRGAGTVWTSVAIGQIIESGLGMISDKAALAFSFVSAGEAIADQAHRRAALERFGRRDHQYTEVRLPKPTCDICAARIGFALPVPKTTSLVFGILLKADRRSRLGQYRSHYVLIEATWRPPAGS